MGIEGYYEDYFDDRQEKEKLTNFQKIKNMSLDEMVEFIRDASGDEYICSYCSDEDCEGSFLNRDYNRCNKGMKQWLQEESEEQMSVDINYKNFYTILLSCIEVTNYHGYLTDEEFDKILDKLRLIRIYLEKV